VVVGAAAGAPGPCPQALSKAEAVSAPNPNVIPARRRRRDHRARPRAFAFPGVPVPIACSSSNLRALYLSTFNAVNLWHTSEKTREDLVVARIGFIGAGSAVFGRRLVTDLLYFPELQESTIVLMDVNPERLEIMLRLATKLKQDNRLGGVTFEATTDRRRAVAGADYVISSFEVGSTVCRALDQEIPYKYGLRVCYSGGTQRLAQDLRQIPAMIALCRDMEELCPDALLLNYGNPVPDIAAAIARATRITSVGLCHSVPGTARQLAGYLDVPFDEVSYLVAGINHQAWFLRLERRGEDLYPRLRRAMDDPAIWARDRVRFELMRYFGYFVTESSRHNSDYVPYFHAHPELEPELDIPPLWYRDSWYREQAALPERLRAMVEDAAPARLSRSSEYGAELIHAIETNTPYEFYGNVMNTGLVTNLSSDLCVEVPCLANGQGFHPCYVGTLPDQLAALNQSFANAAKHRVRAALTGDRQEAYYAAQLDPLTAASVTLPKIREMVDELIQAEIEFMPQFR
jgi:alpha-galactosidase